MRRASLLSVRRTSEMDATSAIEVCKNEKSQKDNSFGDGIGTVTNNVAENKHCYHREQPDERPERREKWTDEKTKKPLTHGFQCILRQDTDAPANRTAHTPP